jgi:hypothetical protein
MPNNIHLLGILTFLYAASPNAQSQGSFQNLGFESATLVSAGLPDPAVVQFDSAFPGWTGLIGTNQTSLAYYNEGSLDSSRIAMIDAAWSASPSSVGIAGPINGKFSALLFAGVVGSATNPQDTFLSQTALVPSSVKSLLFKAYFSGGSLGVSLAGQPLAYVQLETAANYTLFAADIQQWAGQIAELEFTLFTQRPHQFTAYAFLDSIEFSDMAIPEPSSFGLVGLGAFVLGWRLLGNGADK